MAGIAAWAPLAIRMRSALECQFSSVGLCDGQGMGVLKPCPAMDELDIRMALQDAFILGLAQLSDPRLLLANPLVFYR